MTINIYTAAADLVEEVYAQANDPASHRFSERFIRALIGLSQVRSRSAERYQAMLANCLASLSSAERAAVIGQTPISSSILAAVDNPPDWPDPLALDDIEGLDAQALYALAKSQLNRAHADFLRTMTGNGTIEERDTWKPKEDAARAYVAGTASQEQSAMIETEAAGDGTDPADLAAYVVQRANASYIVIGMAGRIKAAADAGLAAVLASGETDFSPVIDAANQGFADAAAQIAAAQAA